MSTIHDTQRRVFSVARQLASTAVRRAALATLEPKALVMAVDPETHANRFTAWLESVDHRREALGLSFDEWPSRYEVITNTLRRFLVDDDGREVHPWVAHKEGGLVFVRWWDAPLNEPAKPRFSWAMHEAYMRDVIIAIQCDAESLPEVPWRED